MSTPDSVFVYLGRYPNRDLALGDYDIVKDLHFAGEVGAYDAAVIYKDDKGKVHVNKDESATRHGAWGGAVAGALVGLLFPPAILGATAGGVGGHLWKGMSRSDVKELGEFVDAGEACLLVIGESNIEAAVDKAALSAEHHVAKQLQVSPKDVDAAVKAAGKDLA